MDKCSKVRQKVIAVTSFTDFGDGVCPNCFKIMVIRSDREWPRENFSCPSCDASLRISPRGRRSLNAINLTKTFIDMTVDDYGVDNAVVFK